MCWHSHVSPYQDVCLGSCVPCILTRAHVPPKHHRLWSVPLDTSVLHLIPCHTQASIPRFSRSNLGMRHMFEGSVWETMQTYHIRGVILMIKFIVNLMSCMIIVERNLQAREGLSRLS